MSTSIPYPGPAWSTRLHNTRAGLRAIARVWRHPSESEQVIIIVNALRGRSGTWLCERLAADPVGRRILDGRDEVAARLADHAYLAGLPEHSLGRAYLRFCRDYSLSLEGLVIDDGLHLSPELRNVGKHLRDTHDLWHVVLGYPPSLLGEVCISAACIAQTRNPGIFAVMLGGALKLLREQPRSLLRVPAAYRRGRRTRWLVGADWAALLPLPLAEVRARLSVPS